VFTQHDPDLAGELSEISVQTPYPASRGRAAPRGRTRHGVLRARSRSSAYSTGRSSDYEAKS
jgi:hypothetical protein